MARMQSFSCEKCGADLRPRFLEVLHEVKCGHCGTTSVYDPTDHREELHIYVTEEELHAYAEHLKNVSYERAAAARMARAMARQEMLTVDSNVTVQSEPVSWSFDNSEAYVAETSDWGDKTVGGCLGIIIIALVVGLSLGAIKSCGDNEAPRKQRAKKKIRSAPERNPLFDPKVGDRIQRIGEKKKHLSFEVVAVDGDTVTSKRLNRQDDTTFGVESTATLAKWRRGMDRWVVIRPDGPRPSRCPEVNPEVGDVFWDTFIPMRVTSISDLYGMVDYESVTGDSEGTVSLTVWRWWHTNGNDWQFFDRIFVQRYGGIQKPEDLRWDRNSTPVLD